ncbi:MAG TPA: AMP-binding protein [Candidatus Acidoferrales bacterium]|jgi:long-chain acyl-CoA synthetase|nr:AMP-binding protein [Candidatus Acidoferrales bacterium]
MPNFLENTFTQLQQASDHVVLREIRGTEFVSVSGAELLDQVARARAYLRGAGLQAGARCALLGPNSIRWAAIDLALMAEGLVVVPLYSRQAPAELVAMMKDCTPRLLITSDAALAESVSQVWLEAPPRATFDEILQSAPLQKGIAGPPNPRQGEDLVTIIYTSGTSGEPKGVCLNTKNLDHMLFCTTGWIDHLDKSSREPLRVFQYLPFNFAASWIVMMSCLTRETVLTLSTDLNKLADEIRLSAPNYFFNVPTLLERVKRGVEEALSKRGSLIRTVFKKGRDAWQKQNDGESGGSLWLFAVQKLIFSKIRERFGPNLRGLVCGSAPLVPETQEFFAMLGIPIWQVYGLTETCGICTMDDPRLPSEPGRVGQSVPGIEMKTGENEEILVSGPNIFPGYWNRPEETARVLEDGWFHTGDQGEVNSRGNWRISGRIKNLIILNSGHNIAPEPIEEKIAQHLPGAQQVVIVGNGRGYLCALVTGAVEPDSVQSALDLVNSELPHYRQVRNFAILREVFTPENALLTANGKLKRDVINKRFDEEIDQMYRKQAVAAGSNA